MGWFISRVGALTFVIMLVAKSPLLILGVLILSKAYPVSIAKRARFPLVYNDIFIKTKLYANGILSCDFILYNLGCKIYIKKVKIMCPNFSQFSFFITT